MNKHHNLFLFLIVITIFLLIGIVRENIYSVQRLKQQTDWTSVTMPRADIKKIKSDLNRAGIQPHIAKYWKETDL